MMKSYFLNVFLTVLLAFTITFIGFGQAPDTTWTRTFGGTNIDIGHSVQQTQDMGYIITGYTRSFGSTSGRNVWLVKTDIDGNLQWQNTFGGNNDDEGYSVKQTSDGGYIITGHTKSLGAGMKDVLLIKTDSLGNQEWLKTYGGSQDDEGYSVLQTQDEGYIVAGVTSSYGAGGRDVFLIKTDQAGNVQWTQTLGGMSSDGAWSIVQTTDGGFAIAGWTFSHGPGPLGNAWLVKTDDSGNQQWHKAFGGSGVDRAHDVKQLNDGGYIITGYTSSSGAGLDDLLLIRTDSLGNEIWNKTFGGTGRDYGQSVQQTEIDGGIIVAGYTLSFGIGNEDMWLLKTDLDGNLLWDKTIGGSSSDVAYAVQQTLDGGFILTGHTLSYGAGVHDVWLVKIESELTSVENPEFTATNHYLMQNFPNPFSESTIITIDLPTRDFVSLSIYDLSGRIVRTLINDFVDSGIHSFNLIADDLTNGVYIYKLQSSTFIESRKMTVLK